MIPTKELPGQVLPDSYAVAVAFPYAQTLVVHPGGEIQYKIRLLPPDKKKAAPGKVSLVQNTARASVPLAVRTNFTAESKFHVREGCNGYGRMPQVPVSFTRRAKNSVRFSAAAIERAFGLENCFFLTGTLPGSTSLAKRTFAEWSSWFMDCLNKWLKRNYSVDGNCYRVIVWELQVREALHLHAIVIADSSIIEAFQQYWIQLLEKLSDRTGVDLFARSYGGSWRGRYDHITKSGRSVRDVIAFSERVTKSVSSYLSKYLVPECGDFRKGRKPEYYPARWWSISRAARNEAAAQTIKLPLPRVRAGEQYEGVNDFVSSVMQSAGLKVATSVCAYPKFDDDGNFVNFQETHVGFVAWGDYDKCVEVAKLIAESLQGDLEHRGNVKQISGLRFACAWGDLKRASQWRDFLREEDGYETLQSMNKTYYERQKEGYRETSNFYVTLNAELKQLRMNLNTQTRMIS